MKINHIQSTKELLKHILFKIGAKKILAQYRKKRGYVTDHLTSNSITERFQNIYKFGVWVHADDQKSSSGLGSENRTTINIINQLPKLINDLNCKTLVDVGCGDWNWMANIRLPCHYIGIDIVPEVIKANKRYENDNIKFIIANAVEDEIPSSEVILCREVLFHLSFSDSKKMITNIKKSAKWLIATTDQSIWFNSDIDTGDFRNINLQKFPYNFPKPEKIILDDKLAYGRILGVWKTSNL